MKLNLSKQIGAVVGLIVLIVALTIGLTSVFYSSNALLDNQKDSMLQITNEGAQRVKMFIDNKLQVLGELARTEKLTSMNWATQKEELTAAVERFEYLDMAVVSLDGTAQYAVSGETADLADRSYIQKALKGEANVSNVIISKVTNSAVVMFATPITSNGTVVGVLIGRKDGAAFNDITDELGVGKRGYAFIIGADSTIYSHPNRDLVMEQTNVFKEIDSNGPLKSFGIALRKLGIGKTDIIQYTYNGDSRFTAVAPIPNTDWILCIGNYKSDILSSIQALTIFLLIAMATVLIIGIISGGIVGSLIARPIKLLVKSVNKIAGYDLVNDLSPKDLKILKRSDEIGDIGKALITMRTNILDLVKVVAASSEHIAASSEELTSTTQTSTESANEVAKTIEEIARGATDQAKETEIGAESVNSLGELIAEEQKYLAELNTALTEVNTLKDNGLAAVEDLNQKNRVSSKSAQDIQTLIIETSNSADKIETASQMIKNIASQTNLLALNAAIEAARAGEAGKGFAVVADEIRNLAEQSNNFTDEISHIITELLSKADTSVKAIEEVGRIMESQTISVHNTSEKFDGINNAIDKMKLVINTLNKTGSSMDKKKDEMIATMENLSAISEENAAGTQEAASSVEEQTASMENIADASESLAELAEELQTEIQKFKY